MDVFRLGVYEQLSLHWVQDEAGGVEGVHQLEDFHLLRLPIWGRGRFHRGCSDLAIGREVWGRNVVSQVMRQVLPGLRVRLQTSSQLIVSVRLFRVAFGHAKSYRPPYR